MCRVGVLFVVQCPAHQFLKESGSVLVFIFAEEVLCAVHGSYTVEGTGFDKRFNVFPVEGAEVDAFKKVEDVGVGAVFFAF